MTSFFTPEVYGVENNMQDNTSPGVLIWESAESVFNALGGFSGLKVSEDIDLSIRLFKNGYRIGLIEEAYVYHKRRSTFYKFFRQVFSFGSGRIDLQLRHGNALKLVHLLPSCLLYIFLRVLSSAYFPNAFSGFGCPR